MRYHEYRQSWIVLFACPGCSFLIIFLLIALIIDIQNIIIIEVILLTWFLIRTLYTVKLFIGEKIILKENAIEYHECKLFSAPIIHIFDFCDIDAINAEERIDFFGLIHSGELKYITILENSKNNKIFIGGYPSKDQMYHEIKVAFEKYRRR